MGTFLARIEKETENENGNMVMHNLIEGILECYAVHK